MLFRLEAIITLVGRSIALKAGYLIEILSQAKHRIEDLGKGTLIFIEVQLGGGYFGEDDIVRIEVDYNRN